MYLLDTNVISALRRRDLADPGLARWAGSIQHDSLFLSAITVFELELGVRLAERKDAAMGSVLRAWLDQTVLPSFEGRILPIDAQTARIAASLHVPDPRPERDALIGATAIAYGMTVVTRNVTDFIGLGLAVFNPWSDR